MVEQKTIKVKNTYIKKQENCNLSKTAIDLSKQNIFFQSEI